MWRNRADERDVVRGWRWRNETWNKAQPWADILLTSLTTHLSDHDRTIVSLGQTFSWHLWPCTWVISFMIAAQELCGNCGRGPQCILCTHRSYANLFLWHPISLYPSSTKTDYPFKSLLSSYVALCCFPPGQPTLNSNSVNRQWGKILEGKVFWKTKEEKWGRQNASQTHAPWHLGTLVSQVRYCVHAKKSYLHSEFLLCSKILKDLSKT